MRWNLIYVPEGEFRRIDKQFVYLFHNDDAFLDAISRSKHLSRTPPSGAPKMDQCWPCRTYVIREGETKKKQTPI